MVFHTFALTPWGCCRSRMWQLGPAACGGACDSVNLSVGLRAI